MARGGKRPGAGRKATDRPSEPLLTSAFTVRWSDVGVLNRLGHGNHSLGLRRLIDQARGRNAASAVTTPPERDEEHPYMNPSPSNTGEEALRARQ